MSDDTLDSLQTLLNDLKRCRPYIQAALDYGGNTHTFDDIVKMIFTGRLRFWPLRNSALLTEVLDYPQEKHYHMFLGGGDLQEILDMHPVIEQAARDAGCVALSVTGRKGWSKVLKAHGWEYRHIICYKQLIPETP